MALRTACVVLAIFVVTLWAPVAASSGRGSVYVTTLPPGATVWMDGNYMGETPLYLDGLDGGRHFITLTHSGWQPQSTAIDVTVGRVTTVSAVLTANAPAPGASPARAKGTLTVRGATGAKIVVDGVTMVAPYELLPLSAGDHILFVQRGSERTTSRIRIYPDTATTVSLAPRGDVSTGTQGEDMLAALADYVPVSDFTVSGDVITIHYKGIELECAAGSHTYVLNGKPGTLTVAPAFVSGRPYLPLSLLNRIASQTGSAGH